MNSRFAILDTNHFSALVAGGPMAGRMVHKALSADADLFTTVVTAQETVQGWLAVLNRELGVKAITPPGSLH